ncbi:MAG: hypothetical protein CME06_07855 [Gemmatimonadetes bacterium]|nr:hypothetical protein [Gemmatimonadota bacterium]
MAILRPFAAVRPDPAQAASVASVPYDVVDTEEARALAAGNDRSFLRVVRPEIDLEEGTDPYDESVYQQGRTNLDRLIASRVLVQDDEPALYLYRQKMGAHTQVGVVGCCSVDEYDADTIKKHETTRPEKENDRTKHLLSLRAHAGPVFLTYRGEPTVDRMVREVIESTEPVYDFMAPDGIAHAVWRVVDSSPFERAFELVPSLYVADGHHRAASASRARAVLRDVQEAGGKGGEYDRFLAVLFPADQLRILAYNRIVHDLAEHTTDELLSNLDAVFEIVEDAASIPPRRGHFSAYLGGRWYGLRAPRSALADPDPVASLDAAILQSTVLGPLLGISDPRTSKRIEFVGGIRGTTELQRRVDRRGSGIAFSLHPLSVDQLMAVADAGRVLPPKSTWFEPKLRSGLVIHLF